MVRMPDLSNHFPYSGKQYDKFGNLKDWWTVNTEREYNDRAECFINQYDNFREPITGLYVSISSDQRGLFGLFA